MNPKVLKSALIAMAHAASGCAGGDVEFPSPTLKCQFDPPHLTTNVVPPFYLLHGEAMGEDARAEVLQGTSLVRTSTQEPVPTDVVALDHRFQINPRESLDEGWYTLRLSDAAAAHFSEPREAEVHVGSKPLLARIEACAKDADHSSVAVRFSEPVDVGSAVSLLAVAHVGDGTVCSASLGDSAPYSAGLWLQCPFGISGGIVATLQAGILAPTGLALSLPDGRESATIALGPVEDDGCRRWAGTR